MDKQIALPKRIVDEPEGLLEMRRHFVAWDVESVDGLVVDVKLFGVINAEHRG